VLRARVRAAYLRPMQKTRLPLLAALTLLAVASFACGGPGEPVSAPTPTTEATAAATLPPSEPVSLQAHRFIGVGQSFSIAGLGEVLGVESIGGGGVLNHDVAAEVVGCATGGAGFVRARYRDPGVQKNRVQTVAVVCIDEVGDCEGQAPVALDFEQFGTGGGEANYLAQGTSELYAVCVVDGRYRLQQPPEMPPLMLRLIDAVGDGPYTGHSGPRASGQREVRQLLR